MTCSCNPNRGHGVVDVHAHAMVRSVPPLSSDRRWPRIESGDDASLRFVSGRHDRRLPMGSWDYAERLRDMDRAGCEVQFVSPQPQLFLYWADGEVASTYCADVNRQIADGVSVAPTRLHGLGTVPLQSPDAAVDMLQEVRELGLIGVEIGTNVNGVLSSDERFVPFYQEAARLGLLIFVHSYDGAYQEQLPTGRLGNAQNLPGEMGVFLSSFVVRGVLDRCEGLKMLVSHGGGSAVLALRRLERAWRSHPDLCADRPEGPLKDLRQLYYDTLTYDAVTLDILIDRVGSTQLCIGSDYPSWDLDDGLAWNVLASEHLSDAELNGVLRGNALALIGATTT